LPGVARLSSLPRVIFLPFVFVMVGAGWGIWIYNRLVRQRNLLAEAWSGIDVQLKRRHELVPRLVACVQGYRDHERTVLENVTHARQDAQAARNPRDAGTAEAGLSQQLRQLVAVAEAYPELKADANFRQLFAQLVETEDQLQYARRYYNGSARDLNNLIESFPSLLVARVFGFAVAEFFTVESAVERAAPAVSA